ncbi:MAG: hypothetical protein DRJ51_04440 [Thermoprotei archaeon]|nr:MAG: hypothetical protein DRJ51_04440 [Thermoprotei archaeon]RLE99026.1 MAG: hypothetical protein DRJ59_08330 [Thermoprotei archaeon]
MEPFNYTYYSRLAEENRKRVEKASEFEEPDRVPVIISLGGPYYAKLFGYTLADYYGNLSVMLDVQIKGIKWRLTWLKDDLPSIGVWLDIGSIAEGIVFNCRIEMPDEKSPWKSPWIVPCIETLEDIDKLEVPDPHSHRGVKAYYEKLEKFKKLVKENYGDIPVGGKLQIHPPVSAAGSLMGPRRLYSWLYRHPQEMHKLLRKLEEAFKALQEYYYEITGSEPGSLGLADDHSGYLNRKMYEKFTMPYNLRLYELYGFKRRSLHMDSHMDHITDILVNVYRLNSADVGVENDIRIIASAFKGKIVFSGNADWRVLLEGPLEKIEIEVEKCIYYAAPGGGYIFDNGGETYVGVPPDRLRYEVEYAKKVGRYPIRKENFKHLSKILDI